MNMSWRSAGRSSHFASADGAPTPTEAGSPTAWWCTRSDHTARELRTGTCTGSICGHTGGRHSRGSSTGPARRTDPTIAGRFMLFHRGVRTTRGSVSKVMLYDRRTQSTQVLDREDRQFAGVSPGQVNGEYVVWAHWFRVHDGGSEPMPGSYDSIVRYHIPSGTTETVFYAEPGGEPFGTPFYRGAWSPGVGQDGTVYFWRDHYPDFWPGDDPHTGALPDDTRERSPVHARSGGQLRLGWGHVRGGPSIGCQEDLLRAG